MTEEYFRNFTTVDLVEMNMGSNGKLVIHATLDNKFSNHLGITSWQKLRKSREGVRKNYNFYLV